MFKFLGMAVLASAVDIGAALALKYLELGQGMRIAVALTPLPGNLALIGLLLHGIRKLDEFQKRLHFEAVVIAFLATGVSVFIYGYLQKAHVVGPFNTLSIWIFMSFAYAAGYLLSLRHYR
jgi:hypothetical protein